MWFPNRWNTNRAVQAQKMACGQKFGIQKVEEFYYQCSQLLQDRSAPLVLHIQNVGFLMTRLKLLFRCMVTVALRFLQMHSFLIELLHEKTGFLAYAKTKAEQ